MDQERFYDAVKEGNIELVQEMLMKDVDANALNQDGEKWCTALYRSVQKGDLEMSKLLVENGADCNIGQLDFDFDDSNKDGISTPIDFLCKYRDSRNNEILKYLLETRPMISNSMVEKRIRYCTQLFGEKSDENEMLFDYAASFFLRRNMYDYLFHCESPAETLVAAVLNFDATYENESLDQSGTRAAYFTLVIRSQLEQLVRFRLENSSDIKSWQEYEHIFRELRHNLEAYNLFINIWRVPYEERKESFYPSIVKNIIKQLRELKDKQEYTLPMAWKEHAVCLNFVRQSDSPDSPDSPKSIAIRIDNLNDHDINKHKCLMKPEGVLVMIPKIIGEIPLDKLDQNEDYFKSLLECIKDNNWPKERGIALLYEYDNNFKGLDKRQVDKMTNQLVELSKDYNYNCFKVQLEGNYFIKSHEPGSAIRSNDSNIFQLILQILRVYLARLITETKETQKTTYLEKKRDKLEAALCYYWEKEPAITTGFELIKEQYQQYRIKRLVDPRKTFPIEQSYINLTIVKTKEQEEKENKLRNKKPSGAIMSTSEEIYDTKTVIEAKDIFEKCKDKTKKVLVLGRPGIGKTTFCQYIAHQWATGKMWPQFELVVLIPLRHLTADRYPSNKQYSRIDLVKKEYFPFEDLSKADETFFKERCEKGKVLWILDGYDELTENIPESLKDVVRHVCEKEHHIITPRPYSNTLSYDVQLEITGFTDDNIAQYVKQFFDQIENNKNNASFEGQELLTFLKCNPRIWDVAHISINLELICSLWADRHLSKTKGLTMTGLYDYITEWLCRRYLEKQNKEFQMSKQDLFDRCSTELAVLETLAFKGMEKNSIILHKELLEETLEETKYPSEQFLDVLNIGILISFDDKLIGIQIDVEKDYYFMHLSFQEDFAARYLVNALNGTADQKQKAIDFIKTNKYNQRFELVFTFASGLLIDCNRGECLNLFWETLLGEPLDLVGLRHVQIVIACMEEANCSRSIPKYHESMDLIIKWIHYRISKGYIASQDPPSVSLRRSPSLVNQPEVHDTFVKLYKDKDPSINKKASSFISDLPISNPYLDLIQSHLTALNDKNMEVRWSAREALGKMGEKAATNEVINELIILLDDTDDGVRISVCEILGRMGTKAATIEVINKLIILLDDTDDSVRSCACEALGRMGEKAATNEVIHRLLILVRDTDDRARRRAREVLENMGEKAATNEVINRLLILLGDMNYRVRSRTSEAIEKISEKAATNEVIDRFLILLGDMDDYARHRACEAIENMGENVATIEVINKLIFLLRDTNDGVRRSAVEALYKMCEKAATNEVINELVILLDDTNDCIRISVCEILGRMGTKAATIEVINKLIILLDDTDDSVRSCACEALGRMGEKAATNEVIHRLLILVRDTDDRARRRTREVLENMGEKAATNEVINRLLILLGDMNYRVRSRTSEAIEKISEKAATNEVIDRFLILLGDMDDYARHRACEAIENMGENVATIEVINKLIFLLRDTNDGVRRSAVEALYKMCEKAATNGVINKLVILLDDTNDCIRSSVCEILGRMGTKAATIEVIKKLIFLLRDTNDGVKRNAFEALYKMCEKAAANEVINKLIILLDDTDDLVRKGAREAVGNMGEKAATIEVINKLISLLDDTDAGVKSDVCNILGRMGEKAATIEVINKLISLLDDKDDCIRSSVCEILGRMGTKAATNEVINKLISLLDDKDDLVRKGACEAVGNMGEKAATIEVINKLIILLRDTNDGVKWSVTAALGKMCQKAATNEVINKLIILLYDTDAGVKSNVCKILGTMGEKAATIEVINRLLILLSDRDDYVKRSAVGALGEMGKNAATDNVINELISLLDDTNDRVKEDACEALGKMGEKAAANEVINKLLILLGDRSDYVKRSAAEALGKMGEKAATNVVISRLITLVAGTNDSNRWRVREVLCKMGKTAAINEVIEMLLDAYVHGDNVGYEARVIIQKILEASSSMSDLEPDTVRKLSEYAEQSTLWLYTKISPEKFIEAFLKTEILFWRPIIRMVFTMHGYAFTVAGNNVMIFGSQEPVELSLPNEELGKQLLDYFMDWLDESLQKYG